MEQLIQSSDLFVMQVEMDVYTALKKVEQNVHILYAIPLWKRNDNVTCFNLSLDNFVPLQWMFLQLNPSWDGPIKQLLADADAWLCKRRTGNVSHVSCVAASSYCIFVLMGIYFFFLFPIFLFLQICVRESHSWQQKKVHLFDQSSSLCVSSISLTILHPHAFWNETTFCPLVTIQL